MEFAKKILLYASSKSDNKTALKYAISLAEKNEASLTIVDVIREASGYSPVLPASIRNINLHDIFHEERHDSLERLVYSYIDKEIKIKVRVLSGTPFIEIIREIVRKGHNLLITTPQGPAGLGETLFGSTTMHLIRKCPCPVMAIKPSDKAGFSRVMAAIDFEPENEENEALNRKIMALASFLAESQNGELHVVHALRLYGEDLLRTRFDLRSHEVDKIVQRSLSKHQEWLDEIVRKNDYPIGKSNVYLLKGDAGKLIPETARKHQVDLVVMGTVGRTGIPGFFIGNTAEKILQNVDCSVMTVKPDGFVSPVKLE
jgi:nucleotide-binding universal stress UspA family protein